MDFQPISTVPKDGTPVVLRDNDGRTVCVVIRPAFKGFNVTMMGTTGYPLNAPQIFDPTTGEFNEHLEWAYAIEPTLAPSS